MKRTVQMAKQGVPKAGQMRPEHFHGWRKEWKPGPLIVLRPAWHAKRSSHLERVEHGKV